MVTITYEDLEPGRVIGLGRTLVDRAEILAFARRFDPQPFHLDEQAGRESLFGGLCASGWFTASLWMRAYVDTVLADSTWFTGLFTTRDASQQPPILVS